MLLRVPISFRQFVYSQRSETLPYHTESVMSP
jgi:hypothetical protein